MQAEVTGKLKQHFNNALPKQNSTTTGVSVIMVSGRRSSAVEAAVSGPSAEPTLTPFH